MSKHILTVELIREHAGDDDLETVEDIEMIFGNVEELANLEKCAHLRNLTIINTGLKKISNLAPVGYTLEKLCLCDQGLTRIEGLLLPQLRELLLHQNALTRIENLDGCPKLQKLWLFSNKIQRIENLHPLADIREIWLQDNKISQLTGVESLVSLQTLALAANRVTDFKELQRLVILPNLNDLSLDDAHFGSCPLASADGYWNFALCYLKQIRRLDGIEVEAQDREQAEDAYMAQVLRFNDRVAAAQRENQQELLAIETRQRKSASHADVMKQELLEAFQDLEILVSDGRKGMASEHERQKQVRDDNLHVLEEALASLQRLHFDELDHQLEAETKRMQEEVEAGVIAQRDQALFIAGLTAASGDGNVACQHLSDHSPDLRWLDDHFKSGQCHRSQGQSGSNTSGSRAGGGDGSEAGNANAPPELRLMQGYRVYNRRLQTTFEKALTSQVAEGSADALLAGGEGDSLSLYYCGSHEQLQAMLLVDSVSRTLKAACVCFYFPSLSRDGLAAPQVAAAAGDGNGPVLVLFSDPALAARLCADQQEATAEIAEKVAETGAQPVSMVVCRAALGNCHSFTGTEPQSLQETLHFVDHLRQGNEVGQVSYGTGSHTGSYFFLPLSTSSSTPTPLVLPNYHLLCAPEALGSKHAQKRLEDMLQELIDPASSNESVDGAAGAGAGVGGGAGVREERTRAAQLLAQFEERSAEEVRRYEQRVSQEIDPETAANIRKVDEQTRRLQEEVDALRTQIDTEKAMQEQILRDFRHQMAGGGGSRNKR